MQNKFGGGETPNQKIHLNIRSATTFKNSLQIFGLNKMLGKKMFWSQTFWGSRYRNGVHVLWVSEDPPWHM